MSRLTKKIRDKQSYCGYEVKDCEYQRIYNFKRYSELENYVDCDLTLAIDKLGQLEDLEELLGCPLEIVITPYFKRGKLEVFYRGKMREVIRVVAFEEATRPYMDVFYRDNEKEQFKVKTIWLDDYKKTWWLREDKSE